MIEDVCVLICKSGQESKSHYIVLECTELEARTIIFLLPIHCYETGGSGKILPLLDT